LVGYTVIFNSTAIGIDIRKNLIFQNFLYLICLLSKVICIGVTFFLFFDRSALLWVFLNNADIVIGINTIIVVIGSLLIGSTGNDQKTDTNGKGQWIYFVVG
jgi:hypothetical protein